MMYFVGLDWAAREHAVCVVDERGAVVTRFTAAHTTSGMADLVARLTKLVGDHRGHAVGAPVAVGPDGLRHACARASARSCRSPAR